jgi:hypothetical protein
MLIKTPYLAEPVNVPSLHHRSNYTCGGVTGHAQDCERSECMQIVHDRCSPDSVHPIKRVGE